MLDEIKAYIFDLDDTLYEEMQFVRFGMKEVCAYLGEKHGFDMEKLYKSCMEILSESGRGKTYDILCDRYGIKEDIPGLVKIYRGIKPGLTLYEDAKKFLEYLKQRNLKTGIITDGNAAVQNSKIDGLGLRDKIDSIVVTDMLKTAEGKGAAKPEREVYLSCINELGVSANEAVYIGDNPRKDFIGARSIGMKTVRIVRPGGMFVNETHEKGYEADFEINLLTELINDQVTGKQDLNL